MTETFPFILFSSREKEYEINNPTSLYNSPDPP